MPIFDDPWHIQVLKHNLTKNLNTMFPDIYEEIDQAFHGACATAGGVDASHIIPCTRHNRCLRRCEHILTNSVVLAHPHIDWTPIHAIPMVMKVVARASNRAFLSLPLCRNEELLELGIQFTMDAAISGKILGLVPGFLKPSVKPAALSRSPSNI
jgi:hypothetical protein